MSNELSLFDEHTLREILSNHPLGEISAWVDLAIDTVNWEALHENLVYAADEYLYHCSEDISTSTKGFVGWLNTQ